MEQITLTVSDCVALINQTLDYAYPTIVVEGEVSSFKVSKGKFVFFDLKDDMALLGCFMMVYQLKSQIEDGMKIRVVATPRLTPWGKFSLTVREIVPVGEGNIKRSFELLKAKLQGEGLFELSRKRALPKIPEKIGVIASVESAGYADFIKIIHNRWSGLDITVADVQVQGHGAGEQIIRAVQYFNERAEPFEALVLIRGGGSLEDLSVFNEEPLVRAVAASRIPTVVGVGHEVDVSLCDLASDVRAATPSNAAEIIVPDKHALLRELSHRQHELIDRLTNRRQAIALQLRGTAKRLIGQMQLRLNAHIRDIAHAEQLLGQLDPRVVLRRGYSLVRDEKGNLISEATGIKPGSLLTIELENAIITAGVKNVKNK